MKFRMRIYFLKIALCISFILISFIAKGTTYYIKNNGNDTLSGLDDANAWESISKVNSYSFSPGDSILFKRDDKFIGTLIPPSSGTNDNFIIFGSYGSGDMPIITPNSDISGLEWAVHKGSIYKTTGIPFNPGNILIDGNKKINKINDYWVDNTPRDGKYGNLDALGLLDLPESQAYSDGAFTFYFWDGLDALYCYDNRSSTTYIRFRRGDDPNSKSLEISAENSKAVYINAKRYLIIQNLKIIGAMYGVWVHNVTYSGSKNIIIENCTIESSNRKVYLYKSNGVIVRNNTLTNNYLSPFKPGAWKDGTDYEDCVQYHYYRFFKNRISTTQSSDADQAISQREVADNNSLYTNTILYCVNGIDAGYEGNKIFDNYIEGTSSVGIFFGIGSDDSRAYNNNIFDSNIAFRFQSVDDNVSRNNYIYRNRVYSPNAGVFMYIHYNGLNPSTTTAYLYHNSVICKTGVTNSGYAYKNPKATGFIFINNIFSVSGNNSGVFGGSDVANKKNMYAWYYTWTGGIFYGATKLPGQISLWANNASNLNNVGDTFWDHSIDPPDFTNIIGTEIINAGIDVSKSFTLGGVNYQALPGISSDYYDGVPDIGAFELEIKFVEAITVEGAGGSNIINSDKGSLQLSAAVSPFDATYKAVTWSITDGTGQATISSSGLVTAVTNGTVTAKATAKDGSGVNGTLVINISNQVVKVQSIKVAGAEDTNTINSDKGTLQLNATVSPSNATNKSVIWSLTNETGQATISPTGLVTAVANGTVTAKATAMDGSGVSGTLDITISNQVIKVESITVSGAGNTNTINSDKGTLQLSALITPSDATNKSVTWSITDGTGQATISSSGLVTALTNGTVTAKATANDDSGVYGTLGISISNQAINDKPIVNLISPNKNQSYIAPASILISAEVSDNYNNVSLVEFFNGSEKLGESTTSPWSFIWEDVPEGIYSISATATNSMGVNSSSLPVEIMVKKNSPPSVNLTSPINGTTFGASPSIILAAEVQDNDGTISKVEFYEGDNKLGESSESPWTLDWSNVDIGIYYLKAIAYDNRNASSSSAPVMVKVKNNSPSISLLSPTKKEFTSPADIDLIADANDIDGTIQKVEFYNEEIKLGEVHSQPYTLRWEEVPSGEYTVTAVATDDLDGESTSFPLSIKVIPDIKLFPNPNNGIFTLAVSDPLEGNTTRIIIKSILGKIFYEDFLKDEELLKHFSLSYIPAGTYILTIKGANINTSKTFVKSGY